MILLGLVEGAVAEDADELRVSLPASQAADLLLKAEQLATATQAISARDEEIAALRKVIHLQKEILALEERKQAKQVELTRLAGEESTYWRGRVGDLEKVKSKQDRWDAAKMCGLVGLAGGAVIAVPTAGVSAAAGALGGALLGFILGSCPF